jgi:hypothetical protein
MAIVLLLFLMAASAAEAVTISGKIRDSSTGESIPGVSVAVVGTPRGAAADVEGRFAIPDLPAGPVTLAMSALGYKTLKKDLTLEEGNDLNVIFKLVPEALQMGEINVEVQADKEREYTPQVAAYKLETRQLAALPQLAEPDLFRSLQIMPGVLATSDFSADLNIWGGSSDQNLILLNGIDVYKPTHLGGLFSVFNMDAIKDVKLVKGGFGAKYGGRLSAVVDIADREGNRNEFKGKAGLSFLSSNATLEGPLPHGSWLVAGRRTYIDWATRTLKNNGAIDDEFPYYFYDLNAKLTRDFANGDRISPSAYLGRDVLQLTSNTNDQIHMSWGNATYSIPFVHVWTHKLFSTNTVAGSFFDSDFRFESSESMFRFRNKIRDFTVKSDLTWFADAKHTLDFGVQAKAMDIRFFIGGPSDTLIDHKSEGTLLSAYASDDWRLTPLWTVTPGLRLEHNTIARTTDLLPRLATKVSLTANSSISASWGMYSQYMQLVSMGGNMASIFDSYVPIDKTMNANRGTQYAVGYEAKYDENVKISADVYYKRFKRIIELRKDLTDWAGGRNQDRPLIDWFNVGDGEAWGGDLFIQGEYDRYGFMLGYGLGRTTRSFPAYDNGATYPASFDRLHNGNVFLSRKMTKRGTLEVRFTYGTGQPITKANGVYSPGMDLPGQTLDPGKKNNYRIPDYHRLDIAYRLKYDYKHWKLSPYFEIINVYNQKNTLSLDYDVKTNPMTVSKTTQLPFLPSIGVNVEF